MIAPHIIADRAIAPRPVLICAPGDTLTIPRPGVAVGLRTLGETVLSYSVRLPSLGLTLPVRPSWITEVNHA